MNRREFSRPRRLSWRAAALGVPGAAAAQAGPGQARTTARWRSGRTGGSAGRQDRGGRVLLVQLPALQRVRAKLDAWIKKLPADVVLRRVPVAFRDDFVPQQRLYYALEAMGKVDEFHAKVFHEIHADRRASTEDRSSPGPRRTGLDKAKIKELYNSFSVAGKAQRATQLQDLRGRRRARHGHRRPLLHRRHPGRQHGPRPPGRRLPGRGGARGT